MSPVPSAPSRPVRPSAAPLQARLGSSHTLDSQQSPWFDPSSRTLSSGSSSSSTSSHSHTSHSGASSSRKHAVTALLHPPTVHADDPIPPRLATSPLVLSACSPFYRLSHPSSAAPPAGTQPARARSPTVGEEHRLLKLATTEAELKRVLDGLLLAAPSTTTSKHRRMAAA